jgi:hypothetical protein
MIRKEGTCFKDILADVRVNAAFRRWSGMAQQEWRTKWKD